MKALSGFLFFILLCSFCNTASAAAGDVTIFTSGFDGGNNIGGIVTGPDNNIWFTKSNTPRIGMITTAGQYTYFGSGTITNGSGPNGITVGADSNLWFTEANNETLGRITTSGVITEFHIFANGAIPFGVVGAPDGNLWVTEVTFSQLGRVTTAGSGLTEFSSGITPGNRVAQIIVGPDNQLWFTEVFGKFLGKAGTDGTSIEFSSGSRTPNALAAGPDGNIWFTELGNGGGDNAQIGRMSTSGAALVEFNTGLTVGTTLGGIVAGSDGNLWFTEPSASKIGRITPTGTITEFSLSAGANPGGITSGPDGNIWFTTDVGIGQIIVGDSGSTDECPSDADKIEAGICGCGVPDTDTNDDAIIDCGVIRTFAKSLVPRVGQVTVNGSTASATVEKLSGNGLSYEYALTSPGKKKSTKLQKSNKLNLKKLKSGSYKLRFRIKQTKGKKISRSKYSDFATWSVS